MLNGCDISILQAEVDNRRKRISIMKEKYAELKSQLIQQINEIKNEKLSKMEEINQEFKKQKEELISKHNEEVNKLKEENEKRIQKLYENIKPNRFVEAQIESTNKDLSDTLAERESKTVSIENEAFEQIQPLNEKASELQKRMIDLHQQIEVLKKSGSPAKKEKSNHPTEMQRKMRNFATIDKENKVSFDIAVKKLEKKEEKVEEVLEYENNKIRKQIKEKQENVDLHIQLISQIKEEHDDKMNALRRQIYDLTKEPLSSSSMTVKKKPIKRIKEKIEYFDLLRRNLKVELASKNEKLKRMKEKNRALSFEVRKKSFSSTSK